MVGVDMPLPTLLIAASIGVLLPQTYCSGGATSEQTTSKTPSRLVAHELRSQIFGNSRSLRVLVPPGYDAAENRSRRYPVLYLNDGQNLFDASTSVYNPVEWQVDEAVTQLIAARRIPEIIVVGVDNAGRRDRASEYLPYPDEYLHPPVPSPRGKDYPDFLIKEVMPFINQHYRTQTGPQNTGVGGSSYGAAAALYAAMTRPGVFGRVLLESPSLYISNERLLKESVGMSQSTARLYVGIGTKETGGEAGDREAVELIKKFGDGLRRAGFDERRLLVVIEEGGTHREDVWGRRLPRALEFLYRK
jgi:predicted alpha/beta superfamily hydrolase